ncbi:MAG: DUF2059 domain-containing protein [bacterium]
MRLNPRLRPALCAIFFLLLPATLSAESADPKKTADIHRLLEITGAIAMGSQMVDQLLAIQAQAQPAIPAQVWSDIREEIDFSEFEPAMVHIYDKHFSAADIEGLLTFYESDVGRRFIEKQPALVQDSMAAGQAWAIGIQEKLRTKLEQRGFKPTRL